MGRRSRKRVRPTAGRTAARPASGGASGGPATRPASSEPATAARGAAGPAGDPPPTAQPGAGQPAFSDDAGREKQAPEPSRRNRSEERNAALRARLEPLAPGERPAVLVVATVVCVALIVLVLIGYLTHTGIGGQKPQLSGFLIMEAVLLLAAYGLWRCRYWAVLGFQALLAFQILVASLSLAVASNLLAAALCVAIIGLGGWLFWKLVRVMGRLQVPERGTRA